MAAKKEKKKGYAGYKMVSEETIKKERARQAQRAEAAEKNAAGRQTNAYFAANDEGFKAACEKAGVPATARQASKWFRKRGLAYTKGQ
jgi:hypothetical protein